MTSSGLGAGVLGALLLAATAGCAANGPQDPASASTAKGQAAVTVDEVQIASLSETEIERLFHEASAQLLKDDFVPAAETFDRVVRADPAGRAAVPSLFNAGIAYHGMGKLDLALERFKASIAQGPEAATTKDAHLRLTRIYGQLERWQDLEKAAAVALARGDLTVLERIGARGALGLGLIEQGRVEDESADPQKCARGIDIRVASMINTWDAVEARDG
jgi:tetratricopeptide (TPR) repeat protein